MRANDQQVLNAIIGGATYKAVNVYRERITEDGKELYRGEQVIVEDKLVGEDCTVVLTDRANGVVFEWWQGAGRPVMERGSEAEVMALSANSLSPMVFDAMPDTVFNGDRWDAKFNVGELKKWLDARVFLATEMHKSAALRAKRAAACGIDLKYI